MEARGGVGLTGASLGDIMQLPPTRVPGAPGHRLVVAEAIEHFIAAGRDDLADDVVTILRQRISNEKAADAIAAKLSADSTYTGRMPSTGAVRTWRRKCAALNGDWREPVEPL